MEGPRRQAVRRALGALIALALFAGCAALPEREAPPTDTSARAPLSDAIDRTRARLLATPGATATPEATRRTEAFLSSLIEGAWRIAHAARYLEAPGFESGRGIVSLPGLFNPDNVYRSALLEPDGIYRISGTRGSHALFTLQLLDTYPLVGLSKGLRVIDLDVLGVAPGDPFVIRLGGEATGEPGEIWRAMPNGTQAILARMTFGDWANETPTEIRIERVDASRDLPRGPVHADLAAEYLDRITTLWADVYLARLQQLPENTFPPIRPSANEDGGLAGQQGVITRYAVGADEALVVTVPRSDAVYQGIQLGDAWFATPNPVKHPASRNHTQAVADPDGLFRFVISQRDPGVANWLDPGGAARGYIMIRWQGIRTPINRAAPPRIERVPLRELDARLPAGTARVTPAARRARLSERAELPALKQ